MPPYSNKSPQLPIWNNLETYLYTKTLTNEGWAWEFLRRNPKYKDDYENVRKIYIKAEKLFGPFAGNEKKWRTYSPVIVKDPFTKHGDSPGVWNGRVWDKNIAPEWTYLEVFKAGTWGLQHEMKDPSDNAPPKFRYPYDHPKYIVNQADDYFLKMRPAPDHAETSTSKYIAIGFDLKLPIETQLDKAKKILLTQRSVRKVKRTRNKTYPHLWSTYLSILDAMTTLDMTSNKKLDEIARFIYREEPTLLKDQPDWLAKKVVKVENRLKQARKMRDGGYVKILREHLESKLK